MSRSSIALLVMVLAASFEVGGDALIRKGLRGSGPILVAVGFVILGMYGIIVNKLDLDFSRLLGAYVGFFAIVSVCAGRFLFNEVVPASTWLGLAVILAGSMIIHLGSLARSTSPHRFQTPWRPRDAVPRRRPGPRSKSWPARAPETSGRSRSGKGTGTRTNRSTVGCRPPPLRCSRTAPPGPA